MKELFEHRDMAETVFRDVNLGRATFDDVNLQGARIHNANLDGLVIEDAKIKGLTIFGHRIDALIEAECDRQDPERVRLRAADVSDPAEIERVLTRLDAVRMDFEVLMRATPLEQRTAHPGADRWSATEHLRHLVFAEDLYLNRWLLRNDLPWCSFGYLPPFLQQDRNYATVGTAPTNDLELIIATCEELHAGMRAFLTGATPGILQRDTSDVDFGQGTVGHVFQGMAQHDLAHIRMAEAAIRDSAGAG